MNLRKPSKKAAVVAIVAGDVLLLLLGWFLLVSPQRSIAKSNAQQAQATQVQIDQANAAAAAPSNPVTQPQQPEIRTAYLYKLSKAMPLTTDMPNLLLELTQVVRASGADLVSISPTPTNTTDGTTTITLSVNGDFFTLTDLLYRIRSLVAVRNGALDVTGRLFSIGSVGLTPSGTGRELNGSIALTAFTFGASSSAATPTATLTPTDTNGTSTGATTTTADTTPSASADAAIGH